MLRRGEGAGGHENLKNGKKDSSLVPVAASQPEAKSWDA